MKELDAETKQALLQPFQAAEVRIKAKPNPMPYVTARVVMSRLDDVMPWQWSFKAGEHFFTDDGTMHQKGILIVHLSNMIELRFEDWGCGPKDIGAAPKKQAKHAISDAFKRCAVHLGVGRYLYSLQGCTATSIPKQTLENALLAVGYRGQWDTVHYGPVGGRRDLDWEDEDDDGPPHAPQAQRQATPAANPPAASQPAARTQAPANAQGTAQAPRSANVAAAEKPANGATVSDAEIERITQSVEAGGGSTMRTTFLDWLKRNTANQADCLQDVLSEDVDELVRKLDDLAAKRKAG